MPSVTKILTPIPKKILILALIALLLRLVLMPIAFHSDIWAISFAEYLFAFKGVFNIYNYLGDLPKTSLLVQNYGRNFFTYPPLAYFTLGIFGLILKPFFNADFSHRLAINLPGILSDGRLFWHLFLTKLPYLFFDFGILVLLIKLFDEPKKKWLATVLWLFNPLVFYTSYMVGQFDIIPVFFTVLAVFLAKRKFSFWAALALGVGAAYKMFPLFFLPFLAVVEGKEIKKSLGIFFVGLIPYVLTQAPFLGSASFRQNVLLSNQSQKMLFARMPVSGAEYLSLFLFFYVFLLGLAFWQKKDLWKWFLSVLLVFFGLTHYHPQWFLWITPFLVIFWVGYRRWAIFPLILLLGWLLITLFFEPSLSVGLFAPISPSLGKTASLSWLVAPYYDVFQFKSIVRSVFAGVAFLMIFLLNKTDESPKNA